MVHQPFRGVLRWFIHSNSAVFVFSKHRSSIETKYQERRYSKLTRIKKNSVTLVPKRTIPTERPPPVGEVSGQSFWLQIQRSRVRFPALPEFLSSIGSGTGSSYVIQYYFWGGNSHHSNSIFKIQKIIIIRITANTGRRDSCRQLYKQLQILPLPSQYIFSLLVFVNKNRGLFPSNSEIHYINTRYNYNIH